jgi:hypothetical protein
MKLSILNLGLPEFFDRKSDIIYGLFHAFNDLGFNTVIEHNQINCKSLNIVIGSDIIAGDANAVQQLRQHGIDYAIYEVENFNGNTINYRTEFNLENYLHLLHGAKFVITPYSHNVPHLSAVCGAGKVHYARWGYHQYMNNSSIQRNSDFAFDALFFGLIKGSRVQKYELLKSALGDKAKILTQNDPFTIRDYAVNKSKFGLALSYGETDDFVNPFRLYYMVANGMPVLADHTTDKDNYLDICNKLSLNEIIACIKNPLFEPKNLEELCYQNCLRKNLTGII